MAKKNAAKKSAPRGTPVSVSIAAGVAAILLAAWLAYGTVTIDPFRWGQFVEELIVAVCVLLALRLLCVIRLPGWLSIVCVLLLPAGIALYGMFAASSDSAALGRLLSLAAASATALLTARELDAKPDGTLLTALLIAACLPTLFGSGTTVLSELMRALVMAGIWMAVLAVRQKSSMYLYLAALGFALGGAAHLYAAFAGAGAGVGAVLFAPKKQRGAWVLPAVLMAALPVAVWLITRSAVVLPAPLSSPGQTAAPAFLPAVEPHLLRALDLGLLLLGIRWFIHREDAAVPVLFAVAGGMVLFFFPSLHAPDVWIQTLPLAVLAGTGAAKTARGKGR